jgi:hypothetical protein
MKTYTKNFSMSGAPGSENRALFTHTGAPKNDKKTPGSFFGVTLVHPFISGTIRIIKKAAVSRWTLGFCFTAAFVLAGSDGEWFPWPNFASWFFWAYLILACRMGETHRNQTTR